MTCSALGCDRTHLARGLCGAHYYQARRRERGLWVRAQVPPEALAELQVAAESAGLSIEALAGRALTEWAAAQRAAPAGAHPLIHHA